MKTVAIDSATRKTGMALFKDGELVDHLVIDLSKFKGYADERMIEMARQITSQIGSWYDVALIYMEEPDGKSSNVNVYRMLSEIIGMVKFWADQWHIPVEEVKPSVWRKHCGINQGGKKRDELKSESVTFVKKTFGIDVGDDEADAICLGIAMMNCGGIHA